MAEQREGSGILFRIAEKSSEKAPDFQGEATFNGQRIRLVGWKKQGQKTSFLSLALQPWTQERPRQSREPGDDSDGF